MDKFISDIYCVWKCACDYLLIIKVFNKKEQKDIFTCLSMLNIFLNIFSTANIKSTLMKKTACNSMEANHSDNKCYQKKKISKTVNHTSISWKA